MSDVQNNATRRLHPSIIFASSFKKIFSTLVIAVVYMLLQENYFSRLSFNVKGIIIVSFIFGLIKSFLHWKHFRYAFDNGHLVIHSGIWVKSTRSVSLPQIRNIDIRISLWQRLFNVVEMRIKTEGGDSKALIKFYAVTEREAARIKKILNYAGDNQHCLWQQPLWSTVKYGLSSMQLGSIASILLFVYFQMDFVRDSNYVISLEAYIMHLHVAWRIVVISALTLAATLIVSVFLAIFRFHRFRISLDGDKLQVMRGLVNTHLAEVKLKNITGIRIEDNPLRQAMGTSTVYLDCISSSAEENSSTLLMPWIRRKDISGILSSIFPQWDLSILYKEHNFSFRQRIYRAPYKGFLSFIIVKLLAVGGIALCTYVLFMPSMVSLFWILVAASIALSILWSFLQYKDHFFIINHAKQLSISKRFISRTTVLVNRSSIQQIDYIQTPLQASRKLRDIVITLRTSAFKKKYRIKYLHSSSCKPLYSWLGLRHK